MLISSAENFLTRSLSATLSAACHPTRFEEVKKEFITTVVTQKQSSFNEVPMFGVMIAVAIVLWTFRCWPRMFRIYRTRTSDWNFLVRVMGNNA